MNKFKSQVDEKEREGNVNHHRPDFDYRFKDENAEYLKAIKGIRTQLQRTADFFDWVKEKEDDNKHTK